jgi:glyoxylase-like metal-dependent hydrolase (beta-lactamase superfamily II)
MIEIETVSGRGPVVKIRVARRTHGWPPYYTAAYWVDGLLIDTGCAHTAIEFMAAVKDWRVERVVNTHSHEDHIGANAGVQARFQCPIQAHPAALPILADPKRQPLQFYRRLFWGWPQPSQGEPVDQWIETPHFCFRVIRTPGHSPDHICLFEPDEGWLFSGDAYIGGQDRALRKGCDIQGIISSLQRLAGLPVRILFPGSGTVRTAGTRPIEDKLAYLEELGDRIRTLHEQGLSPRRICWRLFGLGPPIAYLTFGHFSARRLVQSYLDGFPAPNTQTRPQDPADDDTHADGQQASSDPVADR